MQTRNSSTVPLIFPVDARMSNCVSGIRVDHISRFVQLNMFKVFNEANGVKFQKVAVRDRVAARRDKECECLKYWEADKRNC